MKSLHLEFFLGLFLILGILGFVTNKLLGELAEGFIPSYSSCINQGYTKAFCTQTPASVFGPGACRCWDGQLGVREPGFRGACVCGDGMLVRSMGSVGSSGELGGVYDTGTHEVNGHFI